MDIEYQQLHEIINLKIKIQQLEAENEQLRDKLKLMNSKVLAWGIATKDPQFNKFFNIKLSVTDKLY